MLPICVQNTATIFKQTLTFQRLVLLAKTRLKYFDIVVSYMGKNSVIMKIYLQCRIYFETFVFIILAQH